MLPKFMQDFLPTLCVQCPDGHYEPIGKIQDVRMEPDYDFCDPDYTSPYTDISKPSEMSISIRWDANVQAEYLLIYGKMPSNNWLRLHGYPMRRKYRKRRC